MRKPKEKREIDVKVTFTEGWEERFTKAAYELYLKIEKDKQPKKKENENQTE